ncbi:MAG: type I DNA topoisomerase [Thermotogae bacterium]|nr:MAG: type I DNA topoisomerase [Thermotogota bacterium]
MQGKKKKLVIVESPAKASTIKRILGDSYEVVASMGHIVDLPKSRFGVKMDDFSPEFVIIPKKEKIVEKLRNLSKGKEVLLASDMDREGEAIAWHIARLLGILGNEKRIVFSEITPRAIREAVKKPRRIDMNKVKAQFARRILDRIVGYSISPILWRSMRSILSAGRVQSATLKLVCDREKERFLFKPEKYLKAFVYVDDIKFEFFELDGKKMKKVPEEVVEDLRGLKKLYVKSIKKKIVRKKPPEPFKTSTLQQEAYSKLGFSVGKTMMIAQQLYEGIETNEGHIAFITYMRTDSTRISDIAKEEALRFIEERFGEDFKGDYKAVKKGKIQDAHEAIRPTNVYMTPEKAKNLMNNDQYKLYKLIWERFIASQMKGSTYEETEIVLKDESGRFGFLGVLRKRIFDGFELVLEMVKESSTNFHREEGELIEIEEVEIKEMETKPKPRFSEATLVKEMEKRGIGRPSTYATTIRTLFRRKYVKKERRKIVPTLLGSIVNDFMEKYFGEIVDLDFTARMEERLDEIEKGEQEYQDLLKKFYVGFKNLLEGVNGIKIDMQSDRKCECGSYMTMKYGKYGFYLKCEACGRTKSVKSDTPAIVLDNKIFFNLKGESNEGNGSDGRNLERT